MLRKKRDKASAASGEAPTRRGRRRKPLLLAALAGLGAWLVAKTRRDPEQVAKTTEKVADKVAAGARSTAVSAEKVSAKAAAKAQEVHEAQAAQPEPVRTGGNAAH